MGVFAESGAVVLVGSAIVLAALGGFALGAGRGRPGAQRRVLVYRLLVFGLAVSVLIGSVLADAAPRT